MINQSAPNEEAAAAELEWKKRWIQPIVTAIHNLQMVKARDLLAEARVDLAASGLSPEAVEAAEVNLDYLEYWWQWHPAGDNNWNSASYRRALAHLSRPAQFEAARIEKARRVFYIRMHAHMDGLEPLTGDELRAQLAQLPPDKLDDRDWHHVAGWAFAHQDREMLTRAYEALLTEPSEILGPAKWQRVNLMYLLLEGRAERRDVEESIKLLKIKPQLSEFQTTLWPACEKAGLVDAELRQMLAERAEEIENTEADPRPERKTRSIRTQT
ncbi:hypothetical protein JW859_10525 [bacterium]|nr:hypothetical protein [bacterium]